MTENLKSELLKKQAELNENDARFAARLGIGRSYWTHIRNGRPLPPTLAQRAVKVFPDLVRFHLADIQESDVSEAIA